MGLAQGIQAGRHLATGNALGGVIKGILADARAKGLIQEQADANIRLAQSKPQAPTTKGAFNISKTGVATPVLDAEGAPAVFNVKDRIIPESEGMTETELAIDRMTAQRIKDRADAASRGAGGGETNIIQQSAGASSTPASNIVAQQREAQPAQNQAPAMSPEEQALIQLLDSLEQ